MKNKKLLKQVIALIGASLLLVGGIVGLANSGLLTTNTLSVAEQLAADGYTKITPQNFGINQEVIHTFNDGDSGYVKTYSGSQSINGKKTYFDGDISISDGAAFNTYIAYLHADFLQIYVNGSGNTLYIYSPSAGNKVLFMAKLSTYGATAGEYFNLKLATDMVNTEGNTTGVTVKLWVNDKEVAPDSTNSNVITVTDTTANGKNMIVQQYKKSTIKIKPIIEETEEPDEPTTPQVPEGLEGYTKITPVDFKITEEVIHTFEVGDTGYNKPYSGNKSINGKKTYFDADISISDGAAFNTYIAYLHADFIQIYVNGSGNTLYIYSPAAGNKVLFFANLSTYEATAGEYFNLKLATDMVNTEGDTTSVTVKLWVNDTEVSPDSTGSNVITVADTVANGTSLIVQQYMESIIKIKPVIEEVEEPDEPEVPEEPVDPDLPEELIGYKKITPVDFGIKKATTYAYSSGWTNKRYNASNVASFDKSYFEADVSLTQNNSIDNSIRYLGNEQFTFYIGWDLLRVYHYAVDGGIIYDLNLGTLGIKAGEYFNLKIATDISDNATDSTKTDITVRIWINNTLATPKKLGSSITNASSDTTLKKVTITESDSKIDNTLRVTLQKNTTGVIRIKPHVRVVAGQGQRLPDVAYQLEATSGYLLTGSGDLFVNGVATDVGTVLKRPGDYVIQHVISPSEIYIQNVSLYKIGDVNLGGGSEWTADDRAELERIIKIGTTSNAAKKAADINNDGKVAKSDLTLIKKVVKGEMTEDTVIAKYHAPAVTYDFLGGDTVMPIGGYYGPYNEQNITENIYKAIAESGINLIVKSEVDYVNANERSLIEQGLAYAEKYGIGVFVYDTRLNSITASNGVVTEHSYVSNPAELGSLLGDYSKYQSYLGNMIVDEPIANKEDGWETWADDKTTRYKWYEGITTALNSYDNLTGYVNLLGQYHMQQIEGYKYIEYEAYLRALGKSNKLLSFDSYPFFEKKGASGGLTPYLKSLGIVSKVAKEDGYPFWSYIQAGTDFRDDSSAGATTGYLTQAQTLWNVNTSLAFGAKGIVYFPLIQPKHFANLDTATGTYDYNRNGIFGADNNKSGYYTMVQTANKQVAAVDEVLMKSLNQGVIVTGQAVTDTADVENIIKRTDKLVSVTGDDAMVGCFNYQDTESFYVVSYDYAASEAQTITLNFDGNHQYRMIQGGATTYGEGSSCTITASAGEGVLIVLEDCVVYYEDISPYRAESGYTAPEAPAGYIFAGWYKDKACTSMNAVKKGETEVAAYAKFVDAKLLTVKAQITAGTTADSASTSIRFVTSVNDRNYSKIGFKVNIYKSSGVDVRDYCDEIVYKKLSVTVDKETTQHTPQKLFCATATYFKAQIIRNIPRANFDTEFEVTPYWETLDGTIVFGSTAVKTVRQGIR